MKFAVNTYSFSKAKKEDGSPLSQFEMIDAAKAMGFDAVEIVGLMNGEENPIEYAQKLKDAAKSAEIEISCYTIGADMLLDGEVERVKKEVDIAEVLGVHFMRHDASWACPEGKTLEDVLPTIADGCREITEYAEKKNIRTMSENHGHFMQDSDRMVALYKEINHPNYGLLCDIGNFICVDEENTAAVKNVAPYVIYVHAKDFLRKTAEECADGVPEGYYPTRSGRNYRCGTIVGEGVINAKECIKILTEQGYDGYISVEFEGLQEPMYAIKKGLENVKSYIIRT